jgi:energy-coupling factor transporter ATP-binding protein EcfA2
MTRPKRILLVTGMSGAGRSTALKTLEDIGWETVDNLPLGLLDRLLSNPCPKGPPMRRARSRSGSTAARAASMPSRYWRASPR